MEKIIILETVAIMILLTRYIVWKISANALTIYMKLKNYTPPSYSETKECAKKAAKELFKIRNDF